MENLNQDILELIAKHLKGETSQQEESLLEEWRKKDASNKKAYEEFILIWDTDQNNRIRIPDVNKAWEKVKVKSGIAENQKNSSGKVRSLFQNPAFIRVAASVIFVVGLLFLIKNTWFGREQLTEIASGDFVKEVYLPDSSKITLNKNSKISYSQGYNEDKRIVKLDGEAFFEVKRDESKPFIVLSILSKTEVLGTAFNIITGSNKKEDEIQVQHGRVKFSSKVNEDSSIILTARERAILNKQGQIIKTILEDENFIAWKNGLFNFHNTTLEHIIGVLEKNYDVDIRLEDASLNHCKFTGSFEKASIEEILEVLSASINLSYKQQSKKSFLLKGKGCN